MLYQDAHTHFFSRPFFEALAAASPLPGERAQILAEVTAARGIELPGADVAAHRDRWLVEMDAEDIGRMVTFASHPAEAEAVAEAARGANGRLIPYTVIDPTQESAVSFAERALTEWGMRGFVLFPTMHHFMPADPRCAPIFELAQKHRAVVVVHCGVLQIPLRDALGLPRNYDMSFASPLGLVPAANRFPDVSFVIPHFGAGFFRETLMAGMQCANIFVDTSSSNSWMATEPARLTLADVFRRALGVFGATRILFGTDSSVFPRGYREDVLYAQLYALRDAAADNDEIAAVMGGNLARLLPAQA